MNFDLIKFYNQEFIMKFNNIVYFLLKKLLKKN